MFEMDTDFFEITEAEWAEIEAGLAAELEETSRELDKMLDNLK